MSLNKVYDPCFYLLSDFSEKVLSSQEIVLLYIVEGSLMMVINDKTYTLRKDDVLIINLYDNYSCRSLQNTLVCKCTFPLQLLARVLKVDDIMFNCNSIIQKYEYMNELKKILKELLYDYHHNDKKMTINQIGLLYFLLDSMVRYFIISSEDSGEGGDRTIKIKKFIHLHFREQISLTDLAKTVYLSTAYLSKYIKNIFGKSFLEYLNDIRIQHIVNEMINSNDSIGKIALDNGFSNMAMFNQVFRRVYGKTPTVYRAENVRKITPDQDSKIAGSLEKYFEGGLPSGKVSIEDGKQNIVVTVDAGHYEPYRKFWNKAINISSAADLIRSDIQEHILMLKNTINFQYVRFWDVFSKDMFIDTSSPDGRYNFQRIDYILDFIVNNGMRPIIDFGEKPKIIKANAEKIIAMTEHLPIYESDDDARRIFDALLAHILNRYAIKEVENWIFEVWYDDRTYRQTGIKKQRYSESYRFISDIIKKYSPNSLVGGGGFDIDFKFYESVAVIKELVDTGCHLDFISLTITQDDLCLEQGYIAAKIRSYSYFQDRIIIFKKILAGLNIYAARLWVTEWNSSLSDRNFLNDSIWKAGYIIRTFSSIIGEIDLLSYGMGTDICAEYFDTSTILMGGRGLISKDGIMKPAFHAFSFLDRLYDYIIDRGQNFIITTNEKDEFCVLLYHIQPFSYQFLKKTIDCIKPQELHSIFRDQEDLYIEIDIDNVRHKTYRVKNYGLNHLSGSVLDEWVRLDCSENMDIDEIAYLKDICRPHLKSETMSAKGNRLSLDIRLEPNEVMLLHIVPL
jgi:beta-xylosidase/AraC-like DNA-binding protein